MNFSGAFKVVKNGYYKYIYISQVIYNDPATIVFWNDGTKTISKCHPNDTYSKEFGLLMCIHKRLFGRDNFTNISKEWINDSNKVSLKDVRQKYKNDERNIE